MPTYPRNYLSFALLYDVLDPEHLRNAEIRDLDDVLLLRVEHHVLQIQVPVDDASSVAVAHHIQQLIHDCGSPPLTYLLLPLEYGGQTVSIAELHDDEEPVAVFEQLVNLVDIGVVHMLQLAYLLFQQLSFRRADFILVHDIDSPD